jgi:hypothetical protein
MRAAHNATETDEEKEKKQRRRKRITLINQLIQSGAAVYAELLDPDELGESLAVYLTSIQSYGDRYKIFYRTEDGTAAQVVSGNTFVQVALGW